MIFPPGETNQMVFNRRWREKYTVGVFDSDYGTAVFRIVFKSNTANYIWV